jgi:metal-sulfur cluster biosynthetic enzyme
MSGACGANRRAQGDVWDALGTVMDPELDQPVTDLGFVSEAVVVDGHAHVRLRLPTYFCAPNFAYLMVADAYEAVRALPSVTSAEVRLDDHFAATEFDGLNVWRIITAMDLRLD